MSVKDRALPVATAAWLTLGVAFLATTAWLAGPGSEPFAGLLPWQDDPEESTAPPPFLPPAGEAEDAMQGPQTAPPDADASTPSPPRPVAPGPGPTPGSDPPSPVAGVTSPPTADVGGSVLLDPPLIEEDAEASPIRVEAEADLAVDAEPTPTTEDADEADVEASARLDAEVRAEVEPDLVELAPAPEVEATAALGTALDASVDLPGV